MEEMAAWVAENGLIDNGGAPLKTFCEEFHISRETYNKWMRKSDFSDTIEKSKSVFNSNRTHAVVKSLYRAACGYIGVEEREEYIRGEDGKPLINKKSVFKKEVPPNVGAAVFLLTNLSPEDWQNRQRNDMAVHLKDENEMTREEMLKELRELENIDKLEDK